MSDIRGLDPSGRPRDVSVDQDGSVLSVTERSPFRRFPTYRADIGVVAGGAGYAAEIIVPSKTAVFVTQVFFAKPSVAVTMRLIKASTNSTGGTSTNATIVRMDEEARGSRATVRLFTGAPTAGTALGDVFELAVGTGDIVWEEFGNREGQYLKLHGPREALGVNVSGAATIVGYIEWIEVTE